MNDHPIAPGPDLESMLSSTLRAEADRVETDPAALALIRQRTAAGKTGSSFSAWFFRPAVAGATLAFTLVLGTLVGVNLTSNDGGQDVVADPPASALAASGQRNAESAPADDATSTMAAKNGAADLAAPEADAPQSGAALGDPSAMSRMQAAPKTPVHKIPLDDGKSPYAAITSPDSGSTVERTFELKGLARAFEANVIIEVSQNGKVVKRDYATASAGAPGKGEWTKRLSLEPGDYKVEVFEESMAGNGKKLSSDTIWITVAPDAGTRPASEGPAGPVTVDPATTDPAASPADDAS